MSKEIREHFGWKPTPELARRLAAMAEGLGFGRDMVRVAIEEAALRQVSDIFAFCGVTFSDWVADDISTPAEFEQRRALLDLQSGKIDGIRHNVDAELTRLRNARKQAHKEAGSFGMG